MSTSTVSRQQEATTYPSGQSGIQQGAGRGARSFKVFRGLILTILLLLIPQYALGMLINLFIQFPGSLPGGNAWHWAMSETTLIPLHVYLGVLLVLLALVALGFAIASRRLAPIVSSALGLGLIVFAWISGETFLTYGQNNTASLSMALGFLGALLTYTVAYYLTRAGQSAITDHR